MLGAFSRFAGLISLSMDMVALVKAIHEAETIIEKTADCDISSGRARSE